MLTTMRIKTLILIALSIGTLTMGSQVWAHHGNAAYDERNPFTLKGTVARFVWANPHTLIFLDAKDGKGNLVHWSVETLSPGKLARAGWTENAVKTGDQVTLIFSPAKDGSPKGFLQRIVFSDGRQLGMLEHPQ
jgi:hypothetical protein